MRSAAIVLAAFALGVLGCEPVQGYAPAPSIAYADPSRVYVTTQKDVDRPSVVVGVLDFHTDAESEDKGFDELRRHAAALGADAVIGAEFEHGEAGGKSHLSGMAVRFVARDERPYVILSSIDVESDGDDQEKGLDEMRRRARELGADLVIDVSFEHGEEGEKGHLRGKAIRYAR